MDCPRRDLRPSQCRGLTPLLAGRIFCITLVCALLISCGGGSNEPLSQEAYIWQRVWTPAVIDAVRATPALVSGWRILVAQADSPRGWLQFAPATGSLGGSDRTLTAVIRIDGRRALGDNSLLTAHILRWAESTRNGPWARLEIDYDCPTRALPEYADFLVHLRHDLPRRLTLSVTILPTWLQSRHLLEILGPVDEAVLQVHSVIDPHLGLFDATLANRWISELAAVSTKPFKVALPTYGSRVSWDSAGHLVAITSEAPDLLPDLSAEELQASPTAVSDLVQHLRAAHPRLLRGIAWFRLPVAGDQRVWSTSTWNNVMSGISLDSRLEVQVTPDAAGAYQLRIANTGNVDVPAPQTLVLPEACMAADGAGLYTIDRESGRTVWRRRVLRWLPVGGQVRVGWTRCAFSNGEIRIDK